MTGHSNYQTLSGYLEQNLLIYSRDLDFDGLGQLTEESIGTDPNNNDSDNDGMSDGWEYENGLNPLLNDSYLDLDQDGMPNLWEYNNSLNLNFNDALLDPDKDGLTNIQEFYLGSNPNSIDTDKDGMPDGFESINGLKVLENDSFQDLDKDGMSNLWEYINSLKVNFNDASIDQDNDHLTNLQEYNLGSNPNSKDTDKDGMPDGWEYAYGLLINSNDSNGDKDNDGLSNLSEYKYNTNPISTDSDGDGINDKYEIINGLNPLNAHDGNQDFDYDGVSNFAEYKAGTNPNDFFSFPIFSFNYFYVISIVLITFSTIFVVKFHKNIISSYTKFKNTIYDKNRKIRENKLPNNDISISTSKTYTNLSNYSDFLTKAPLDGNSKGLIIISLFRLGVTLILVVITEIYFENIVIIGILVLSIVGIIQRKLYGPIIAFSLALIDLILSFVFGIPSGIYFDIIIIIFAYKEYVNIKKHNEKIIPGLSQTKLLPQFAFKNNKCLICGYTTENHYSYCSNCGAKLTESNSLR